MSPKTPFANARDFSRSSWVRTSWVAQHPKIEYSRIPKSNAGRKTMWAKTYVEAQASILFHLIYASASRVKFFCTHRATTYILFLTGALRNTSTWSLAFIRARMTSKFGRKYEASVMSGAGIFVFRVWDLHGGIKLLCPESERYQRQLGVRILDEKCFAALKFYSATYTLTFRAFAL